MPIDWTDVDVSLDRAKRKTDDELAGKVSSLTRLRDDEVKELFPTQGDVEKLKRLMSIVQSSAADQRKQNELAANIQDLGGIVLKLIERLV